MSTALLAYALWLVLIKFASQPTEIIQLQLPNLISSLWLERDPDLYDADEVGKELERLGILEPEEWRPAPWLVSVIKSFHGGTK